jgi:CheY-like chemotaxis protein
MSTKRILLVDDDWVITDIVSRILRAGSEYRIRTENDSRRAAQVAEEFRPDIILMDVDMPNLDGGDVAQRLRQSAGTRDIPILFLTSLCSSQEATESRHTGSAERFLSKPVETHVLLAEIAAILLETAPAAAEDSKAALPRQLQCECAG